MVAISKLFEYPLWIFSSLRRKTWNQARKLHVSLQRGKLLDKPSKSTWRHIVRERKDSHLHAHNKKDEASGPFGHNRAAKPDSPVTPPSRTEQEAKDVEEKRRHSSSENALESAQDKNPVPPGSTRK